MHTLCQCFGNLLGNELLPWDSTSTSASAKVNGVVSVWLTERYTEFKDILLYCVENASYEEARLGLQALMILHSQEVSSAGHASTFSWIKEAFGLIIEAVLSRRSDEQMKAFFGSHFVRKYRGAHYFFFGAIKSIFLAQGDSLSPAIASQLVSMLLATGITPEGNAQIEYEANPPTAQLAALIEGKPNGPIKEAAEVWTAILRTEMDKPIRKNVLSAIPHLVVSWFPRKEALMDFMTDSFDAGGSTSLLALSGLLNLIQDRALDYPHLYPKLYALLDRNILHSKHRARFLRLLERALGSSHLPAALVASFIKRLSRLCLSAPPAAIVAIVPWIYNQLQTHQSCRFLIHRATLQQLRASGEEPETTDTFDPLATDPMSSGAIDSSLWEIETLQSHYHPNVSAIASIIGQQFLKQSYNLEDFLDHTYGSVS